MHFQQQNGPYALDPNCNSSELREIIVQGISDSPSDSKHRINAAIARNLDGSFGIVCAECAFSYLAHTIQYCHHTRNNITCLVFRDG
ncbi:grl-11 [Pristionchus pacificus]|uniref:Grl-11 n=1 Tax=Pristionchus pacificus TaxID=54126 RepID=A0A2A6CCY0_PRIPA|nr:grl-11 [Pristionchus pacificus]|eukprot:PDM75979.1 grl-11 [Pristionchus pacificus]